MRTHTLLQIAATLSFNFLLSVPLVSQQATSGSSTSLTQTSFDTPAAAVDALITASSEYDVQSLLQIFGPSGKDFFTSSDPVHDKKNITSFGERARQKHSIANDPADSHRKVLVVGSDDWPFPVPLVKKSGKWSYDTEVGHDELIYRRIGTNELDAIQICHGYVEAQKEYAETIHDNSGINQYAQLIKSTPGKQDGLLWQNPDGTLAGPISEPLAQAIEEGYTFEKKSAYHGYYFKILKGQGPNAPLGRLDYVIQDVMIGGFALIAAPAEYRVTGVKTFMVSQDGTVYQKDLGPKTLKLASETDLFNPDSTWKPVKDEWPFEVGTD